MKISGLIEKTLAQGAAAMRPLAEAQAAVHLYDSSLPSDEVRYDNMFDSKVEELATGYPELNWWADRVATAVDKGYMTPLEGYVHLHVAHRNLIAGRLCTQSAGVNLQDVSQNT